MRHQSLYDRIALLNRRVRIVLSPKRTRDRYGRLLAYVFDAETDEMFNARLIRSGYGYADSRFEHPYLDLFLDLETQAREDQRGLWAGVTLDQLPKWKK